MADQHPSATPAASFQRQFSQKSHTTELGRMRLIQHLAEGEGLPLTLIMAPPGYGKTTLLSHWSRQTSLKVAWLNIDSADNDPRSFLEELIKTLQQVQPGAGVSLEAMFNAPEPPKVEQMLDRLLSDMTLAASPTALVLDDYQLIESPAVNNIVSYLVERLPPQFHLFLASTTQPAISLSTLRANGRLKELHAAYLTFTLDEATALMTDVMKKEMPFGDVSVLVQRGQGVAVYMKYAALAARRFEQSETFVKQMEDDEREALLLPLELLLNEVNEGQRQFLRQCAASEFLCEPLCIAMTSHQQSGALLERFAEMGVAWSALEGCEGWYRWHPVVRDTLYQQLKADGDSDEKDVHLRACLWYLQRQQRYAAFRHALAAGDADLAGQLVEQHAQNMLAEGRLVTVMSWLETLPEEIFRVRPMLSVSRAWVAIVTRNITAVGGYLDDAEKAAAGHETSADVIEHIAAIRKYLAGQGES